MFLNIYINHYIEEINSIVLSCYNDLVDESIKSSISNKLRHSNSNSNSISYNNKVKENNVLKVNDFIEWYKFFVLFLNSFYDVPLDWLLKDNKIYCTYVNIDEDRKILFEKSTYIVNKLINRGVCIKKWSKDDLDSIDDSLSLYIKIKDNTNKERENTT